MLIPGSNCHFLWGTFHLFFEQLMNQLFSGIRSLCCVKDLDYLMALVLAEERDHAHFLVWVARHALQHTLEVLNPAPDCHIIEQITGIIEDATNTVALLLQC